MLPATGDTIQHRCHPPAQPHRLPSPSCELHEGALGARHRGGQQSTANLSSVITDQGRLCFGVWGSVWGGTLWPGTKPPDHHDPEAPREPVLNCSSSKARWLLSALS